jgi:hypothetical protein
MENKQIMNKFAFALALPSKKKKMLFEIQEFCFVHWVNQVEYSNS